MDKNTIIELNRRLNETFGTAFGIKTERYIDSAISLDSNEKIAEYIIKHHPFIDGNKRTSVAILKFDGDVDSTIRKNYDILKLLSFI